MSQKTKSLLYFSAFVISALCYFAIENTETGQNAEFAQTTIEDNSEF